MYRNIIWKLYQLTYPSETNATNGTTKHVRQQGRVTVGSREVCMKLRRMPVRYLKTAEV